MYNFQTTTCISVLKAFGISNNTTKAELKNFKMYRSDDYALGPIYSFDYKNAHYYIVEDYSLGDDPELVKDILSHINHLLKGSIITMPPTGKNETKYALTINKTAYYLWKSPQLH